jgi:H+/Cl- antiporter ClcA
MSRKSKARSPRPTARLEGYVFRRSLEPRELLPAIGVGVVAGLAAFYVARLFLERTPLLPEERRRGKHHASGTSAA